jgi:hypothetical protein
MSKTLPKPNDNPFDLTKKKTAGLQNVNYKSRTYTEEEKAALLEGYVSIPSKFWPHIRLGTHMRYETKDGLFRVGGYVVKNPASITPAATGVPTRVFRLQNNYGQKYGGAGNIVWPVTYDNTAAVYVQPDATALVVQELLKEAVSGLNVNIKKLADYSKKLERRLEELERRK